MLEVGERAPEFTLIDYDRKERRLSEFLREGKKTVIAFYPGTFTSVCTKEMCTLRDSLAELEGLDTQVVGISVNDPYTNKAFAESNRLTFPLLTDHERRAIDLYGVTLRDFAGIKGYTIAQRAVFILDREGIIRYKSVSDYPRKETDYEKLRENLAQTP